MTAQTPAATFLFAADLAAALVARGVEVVALELQGPDDAQAVPVLTVRGRPTRYRVVKMMTKGEQR